MIRYLANLSANSSGTIDAETVVRTLHDLAPWARFVGDKKPIYIRRLDSLLRIPNLACLAIYRDCRDVTSSVLTKVRGAWRHRPIANRLGTAAQISISWLEAIEAMERHADRLMTIRYERLVAEPATVMSEVAAYLGTSAGGFHHGQVRADSVGKYREGLTQPELTDVLEIAGPTLRRLGYALRDEVSCGSC